MPNWVYHKITASPEAVKGIQNKDGRVDFNEVLPYPGKDSFDGIFVSAEKNAERFLNFELSEHPLIRRLELEDRSKPFPVMVGEEKEQFDEMVKNYQEFGYLHSMDFARKVWGTKWNAGDISVDENTGELCFSTAWSCPFNVFVAWSKKFPDEVISVKYADEDIGSNCGEFSLKNGELVSESIAPEWKQTTPEQRVYWQKFACKVLGYDYDEYMSERE